MASIGTEEVSAREAEVLGALGDRLTNAQIAQLLHISVRTVESHVSSLLRKLGAADRGELAAQAARFAVTAATERREFAGLPARWTSFVGRSGEIETAIDALGTSRLVTLLGPGGIGKTALVAEVAKQVAPSFPGGGAFVDLVPVSAEFLLQSVAAALDVTAGPQEPLDSAVFERLRQGATLLVIDNCEHVLEAVGVFAAGVLAACPEAVVLATSRERLGVAGERVIIVPPLGLSSAGGGSEAEELFVDRASGTGSERDRALVAEVCRRLDGMPLAIELAAARSASLGVDGLLTGLDDHLRMLTSGPSGRHQSMRAVIDWSHDLLEPDERELFRRLGVFAGAFDLPAVVAAAGAVDLGLASDVVGRLTDKSLLVHRRGGAGSRWRMLETVHAYAREQLEASGELDQIQTRHLEWAAAVAIEIEAVVYDTNWQPEFDAVADDLRAALAAVPVGPNQAGYDLALALAHLTYARRFISEARDHYETAVALAPDAAGAVAALRAGADAAFAAMRGDLAFALLMRASELATDDAAVAALVLSDAASIGGRAPATFPDDPRHEDLVVLVERARALAPEGNLEVQAHVALAAAWNSLPGPTETDQATSEHALALAEQLDDPMVIGAALDAVGSATGFARQYRKMARLNWARLDLLPRLDRHDPRVGGEVADIFHMATESALAAGQVSDTLAAAVRSQDDTSVKGLAHFAATHMVVPLVLRGDFDEALTQAVVMRDGWERSGRPAAGWMAPAFYAIALVSGLRGDDEQRADWWEFGDLLSFRSSTNSFGLYVSSRLAIHHGTVDGFRPPSVAVLEEAPGMYLAYASVAAAEWSVAAGAPDAEAQLAAAAHHADENEVAAATLRRARGRLHGDEDALVESVAMWETVGARYERASTLLLLPDRAAEGHAELVALGCSPPSGQ